MSTGAGNTGTATATKTETGTVTGTRTHTGVQQTIGTGETLAAHHCTLAGVMAVMRRSRDLNGIPFRTVWHIRSTVHAFAMC